KPGDKIERDELFVLIGTDKVESELPCEYEGVLKEILVPEKGETEVGAPICMLEVDEKDVQHIKLEETKLEETKNHTNA
ncbi:biotin/lipoyl-containing protein, partial [Klebsiella pneumoniae]|uniref:biotin/lipoyl-containing protein n=1 Tax=Klebsiella pneumoniae TaxID=573 RepID=UPI0027312EE3